MIALEADTGKVRWRVRLNGEILAAPAISERAVAVRTVDGKLRALSPKDGHELWTQEQQVPRLSLARHLAACHCRRRHAMRVRQRQGHRGQHERRLPAVGGDRGSAARPYRARASRRRRFDAARLRAGRVYCGFPGPRRHARARKRARSGGRTTPPAIVASRSMTTPCTSRWRTARSSRMRHRTGAEVWRQKALLHRGLSARGAHRQCRRDRPTTRATCIGWTRRQAGSRRASPRWQGTGEQPAGGRRATWSSSSTMPVRSARSARPRSAAPWPAAHSSGRERASGRTADDRASTAGRPRRRSPPATPAADQRRRRPHPRRRNQRQRRRNRRRHRPSIRNKTNSREPRQGE